MLRISIGSCLARHSTDLGAAQLTRRTAGLASKLASLRTISTSPVCEGRPRQYADHSRYPRPRSTRPDRPEKITTDALMDKLNEVPTTGADMINSIRVTDDEVAKIFDSIMGSGQRRLLDEQSLRHKTRAEFLEIRRKEKERLNSDIPEDSQGSKEPAKELEGKGDKSAEAPAIVSVSDTILDQMAYIDTRHIREIEEAKRAVIASADSALVDKLQDRVHAAAHAAAETKGDGTSSKSAELGVAEQHSDHDVDLSADLTLAEFNHVIYANTLGGRAEEAMRAYELLRESGIKPDQATFANLTIALAKSGDLEAAVSMFKALETEGLEPSVYSYGTLIRAYMEFDRIDDSFRVYEMMKVREVWPNLPVYNSLIVASLKVGDLKRAWGVFEHLRYTIAKPDEISFSIMIHACAKNGEVEKAMNLLDEMVSNKLTLSDVTFNSLIHACAVRPDYFDEGFRLLQLMESHGFQPDFFTYNTLLYACARKKNLGLARNIFREMLGRSMKEEHRDLVKIDEVTVSNMMWAYSSYLSPVKTCSWKVAKRFESLALDTLTAIRGEGGDPGFPEVSDSLSKHEQKIRDIVTTTRFIDMQANVARATKGLVSGTGTSSSNSSVLDAGPSQQVLDLVNMLMPAEIPVAHNGIGSEAKRLMMFYVDVLKGGVNSRLLNAYLSAMVCNGRFEDAWRIFLGDYKRFNVPKDGWTFQSMIRLCARTRDVPSAWRLWDEFKSWRVDVEKALQTPGHEELKSLPTKVYRTESDDGPSVSTSRQQQNTEGDAAAFERVSQGMLAVAERLEFPGDNAMPTIVAGGSLAVIPSDRENARKPLGCDMATEHAIYIEMITLLGSCGDFRAAVHLIREEKSKILEHAHNPTMDDVNSVYQNAIVAGDKHSAMDIRALCMQKPAHQARRALSRKWGTSFSWDMTDSQQKAMSRRLPESFRRHQAPFSKGGEYVRTRQRDTGQSTKEA
ncbi:hypothetical protein H4218_000874 [Coemansia sp. IMI 209128]|nr:hypothetical protein H4218_000874 [Coemansia sp. IMI 209128]